MARQTRTRKGFTLIELLVVIAIIAILAAILFPVFAQAREKARQTACASNLKQIGIGVLMYTEDADERFPTSWCKGFPGDPNFLIQPYLKNTGVLLCPSKQISTTTAGTTCANSSYGDWALQPGGRDNPTGVPYLYGYGFNLGVAFMDGNGLLVTDSTTDSNGQSVTETINGSTVTTTLRTHDDVGIALAQVASPSNVFMEADSSEPPLSGMGLEAMDPAPGDYPGDACFALTHQGMPHHIGGNEFLYCDGHVKWLKYTGARTSANGPYGGLPASAPNLCSYFASYDGTNDPDNCQTNGN